jgi:hypothetical protein
MSPSDFHDGPRTIVSDPSVGGRDPSPSWISHVASNTLCTCRLQYPGWIGRSLRSVALPLDSGLPLMSGGSAPATKLSRPAQSSQSFGLRTCTLVAPGTSPEASAGQLLAATAPVATGTYRQFPGRDSHPLAFETQEVYFTSTLNSPLTSFRAALTIDALTRGPWPRPLLSPPSDIASDRSGVLFYEIPAPARRRRRS